MGPELDIIVSSLSSADSASLMNSLSLVYNKPMLLAFATNPSLGDPATFPNYWRTSPDDMSVLVMWLKLARHNQWGHMAFLAEYGYSQIADDFAELGRIIGVQVETFNFPSPTDPRMQMKVVETLAEIKAKKYNILFHAMDALGETIQRIAIRMNLLGPTSGKVWLVENWAVSDPIIYLNLVGSLYEYYDNSAFQQQYSQYVESYFYQAVDTVNKSMAAVDLTGPLRQYPNNYTTAPLCTIPYELWSLNGYPNAYYATYMIVPEVWKLLAAPYGTQLSNSYRAPFASIASALNSYRDTLAGFGVQFDKDHNNVNSLVHIGMQTVAGPLAVANYSGEKGLNVLIPDTSLRWPDGTHHMPDDGIALITYIAVGSAEGIFALLVCFLLLIVYFWTIGYIVLKRLTSPVVKLAAPWSLVLACTGLIILLSSAFTWIGKLSNQHCEARLWLFFYGDALLLSALVAKSFRIQLIWRRAQRLRKTVFRTRQVVLLTLALTIPTLFFLVLGTALDPSRPVRQLNGSNTKVNVYCSHEYSGVWTILSFVCTGVLLLASVILSFLNRNLPSGFNDTKYLYIAEASIAVIATIAVVTAGATWSTAPTVATGFALVSIFLVASTMFALVFAPKLYIGLFRPDLNQNSLAMVTIRKDFNTEVVTLIDSESESDSDASSVVSDPPSPRDDRIIPLLSRDSDS